MKLVNLKNSWINTIKWSKELYIYIVRFIKSLLSEKVQLCSHKLNYFFAKSISLPRIKFISRPSICALFTAHSVEFSEWFLLHTFTLISATVLSARPSFAVDHSVLLLTAILTVKRHDQLLYVQLYACGGSV